MSAEDLMDAPILHELKEWVGHWWRPEDPDTIVPGVLSYDQNTGLALQLIGGSQYLKKMGSCHLHRRWVHECVSSPQHAIPVTGHRWCSDCNRALCVAVDELTGSVTLTCPCCGGFPDTAANRQIIRFCGASLAMSRRRIVGVQRIRRPGQ